jgi:hypothetical protein
LQIPDPEMQWAALPGSPDCISKALTTHNVSTQTTRDIQARRLGRIFLLQPETASVIAELAFNGRER